MSFASDLTADALEAVVLYGESVTLSSIVSTYSPATASASEVVTEYTVKVVVQPEQSGYADSGTTISRGVSAILPALMPSGAALAFTPKIADRIVMADTREFAVVGVDQIRAQGSAIAYLVQLGA